MVSQKTYGVRQTGAPPSSAVSFPISNFHFQFSNSSTLLSNA